MILSPTEAALFFKLMLPLQHFANQELGILPKVKTFEGYCNASTQKKYEVRTALFVNTHLLDKFIDENPHDIPLPELVIISTWKRFVTGEFYIERHLKNYTVFISDDGDVYAVSGLTTELDEHLPQYLLPTQISEVVLLPFQDKIVTDGFFVPYPISFGSGIKNELKDIYMKAKKKNKIITSL